MNITLHFTDPTHKPYKINHDLHFHKQEYKVSRLATFFNVSPEFYQKLHSSEEEEVSPTSSRHSYGSKTVRSSTAQKAKPISKAPPKSKSRDFPDSSIQKPKLLRQPKPAPQQNTAMPRQSRPAPYQPTAIPREPRQAPYQPTAIPRQSKPAPQQNTAIPRQSRPAPYQPTAIPRQSKSASHQSQAVPRQAKPTSSSPQAEKRTRAPDAIPKQVRGNPNSISPEDVIPPSKVQRKNPVNKPKSNASSVTPPPKTVTREDIAKKLGLLKGDQIKRVVGMIKDLRSPSTVINEKEKGKFTFDIYTLERNALQKVWTYVKTCLAPARPRPTSQ